MLYGILYVYSGAVPATEVCVRDACSVQASRRQAAPARCKDDCEQSEANPPTNNNQLPELLFVTLFIRYFRSGQIEC